MSVEIAEDLASSHPEPLNFGGYQSLGRAEMIAIVFGAIIIGIGVPTLLGASTAGFGVVTSVWGWKLIVGALAYVILTLTVASVVEGRRKAVDRTMSALLTMAFLLVLAPLVSVVWTVVRSGVDRFDIAFFTETMKLTPAQLGAQRAGEAVGGAMHAMLGTLIVTSLAAVLSVPLGLLTAIYLVEYRSRGRLGNAITSMVDVMTGIPSIVAGLFAYALFEIFLGPGTRSGMSGAVALTVLMTPVVVRSAEEMLRLVPDELREASYALGVPKWKTITRVVLPTSAGGILTGVTLAIARVIGETAPLLVTVGVAKEVNLNPFNGRMMTLPVFSYNSFMQPGAPPEPGQARAWAAALMLVMIVAILFIAARMIATVLKPQGLR